MSISNIGKNSAELNINTSEKKQLSFGQGQLNVVATSDNHGQLNTVGKLYATIAEQKDTFFSHANDKGVVNIGCNSGDWFMNPAENGFKTDPNKTAGDNQLAFFNKFIESLGKIAPGFKQYYVPGNHCFDGGNNTFTRLAKGLNATTIMNNVNINKSGFINELKADEKTKFVESSTIEITDDKNPNKKHKVLILGLTNPMVDFYNNSLVDAKKIDIIDRTDKKDIKVEAKDVINTSKKLNESVQAFKKQNPKGAVIVMGHLGNKITEMVLKNTSGINVVLNGHDHVDQEVNVKDKDGKDVKVISLGSNNDKAQALQLHFNDGGDLDSINSKSIKANKEETAASKEFTDLYNKMFDKDTKPMFQVKAEGTDPKTASGQKIDIKDVRYENNPVANLVADTVFSSVKKKYPDLNVFVGYTATIRAGLTPGKPVSNLELKNILAGCSKDFAEIFVGKVKGSELMHALIEDLKDNVDNKNRNPIIFTSGIEVDRKGIEDKLKASKTKDSNAFIPFEVSDYLKFFKLEGKQIEVNKDYKIALPKEFFKVPNIKNFVKLENRFEPSGKTFYDCFNEYLQEHNNIAAVKLNEKRIKTS